MTERSFWWNFDTIIYTCGNIAMSEKGNYSIEEYKSCKQQISDAIKAMDQIEIFVVGAIAAVYVYMFTQAAAELVIPVLLIPVFLAVAGGLRTWALDDTIGLFNDYMQRVERENPNINFTIFYRANRTKKMKWSRYIVWGFLLSGTVSMAIFTYVKGPIWIKADDCSHKSNKSSENQPSSMDSGK